MTEWINKVKFDEKGLVSTIVQDAATNAVLMNAYMNKESIELTEQTGYMHYFSRSRGKLWKKGETSGNVQKVVSLRLDKNEIDVIKAPKELNSKMKNRSYRDALQSFVNYYATEDQNNALALMLDRKELVAYLESENYLEISVEDNGKYRHNIEIVPQSKTEQDKIESVFIFVKVSVTSILLKN